MSVCISFLLFTTVQKKKKPQSSSLQKKRYRFQATHLFSVRSVPNYREHQSESGIYICLLAAVTKSSGQHVLSLQEQYDEMNKQF